MDTTENDDNDDNDDIDDEVERDINIADLEATLTLSSQSQKYWMSSEENELVSPGVKKLMTRIFCK